MKRLLPVLSLLLLASTARAQGLDLRITAVEGAVDVKFKGDAEWTPADKDTPLEIGDEVKTAPGGRAELGWGGQSVLELQEDADLTVPEAKADKQAFELSQGVLLAHIKKLQAGQTAEFRTKAAVATVSGTELAVQAQDGGLTGVGVYDGQVLVEGKGVPGVPGKQFKINKGQEMFLKFGVHSDDPKPMKGFLTWKDRFKTLGARRIELRRDWQAMSPDDRAARRKQLADTRLKRKTDRDAKLGAAPAAAPAPEKKAAKAKKKVRRKKKKAAAAAQ